MPADGIGELVERLEQLENFRELVFRELAAILQVAQADFIRPKLNQDLIHLHVIVYILDALFAGDEIERRLGDIDVPVLHQLGHLPVKKVRSSVRMCEPSTSASVMMMTLW